MAVLASLRPGADPEEFSLPAAQAIRGEFSPGRISRRFGIHHRLSRHWIPLLINGEHEQDVNVDHFCLPNEREDLGNFSIRLDGGATRQIRTMRPLGLRVSHDAPPDVQDSSNATPQWHSQLLPPPANTANGIIVTLPLASPWKNVFREIRFFTHREQQPICIRRFTLGSRANIRLKDGNSIDVTARFVCASLNGGGVEPVALGFAFEADAVRVRIQMPKQWRLVGEIISPQKIRSLRVQRFRWLVDTDTRLNFRANLFQRYWLEEIVLAALLNRCRRNQIDFGSFLGRHRK